MQYLVRMIAMMAVLSLSLAIPEGTAAKKKPPRDPNEVICKTEEVLGSRLQKRRICRTHAQWEEQRRIDREYVDKTQTSGCVPGAGC